MYPRLSTSLRLCFLMPRLMGLLLGLPHGPLPCIGGGGTVELPSLRSRGALLPPSPLTCSSLRAAMSQLMFSPT